MCNQIIHWRYSIKELIHAALTRKAFEKQVGRQFERYLLLMMDRFLTGHFIGTLTDAYYNLTANGEFFNVNKLIDQIGGILHVDFPVEEKIFAFLPALREDHGTDQSGTGYLN